MEEKESLENISKKLVVSSRLEGIALCGEFYVWIKYKGSLPAGVTGSTYTYIVENKKKDSIILLDACKDIDCLKTGKIDILKVNSEEALHISRSR